MRDGARWRRARGNGRPGVEWKNVNRVALFLVDGLSHREELLDDDRPGRSRDISLIGGSSGDGLLFRGETGIFHGGRSHNNDAACRRHPVVRKADARVPVPALCARHEEDGRHRRHPDPADRDRDQCRARRNRISATGRSSRRDSGFLVFLPPTLRWCEPAANIMSARFKASIRDGSLTFYCAIDEGIGPNHRRADRSGFQG